VGLVDLLLPWIGVPLAAVGLFLPTRVNTTGWWLLAIGVALLVLDLLRALFWSRQTHAGSEQPLLNQRGAQIVGRSVRVVEAIAGGQGKVRIADTIWPVRGPDCAEGSWVKVIGAEGAFLIVATDDERST
jgi:membrane protein implicated in regulation of membrane protease activity